MNLFSSSYNSFGNEIGGFSLYHGAVMLQGDPSKCSVYREEAIDVLIAALDCQICDEKVQEQSARALMMLGGRFSYTGETTTEKWLLEQAGFWKISGESFHCNEVGNDESLITLESYTKSYS